MDVQAVLDTVVVELNKQKKKRSGLINPSSLGQCYRRQLWNRNDVTPTNPPDARALKLFRVGNMFHKDLQSILPADMCEVEFTKEDVHGFADFVGVDCVVDFKTVGNYQWRLFKKKGFRIEEEKIDYILQLMTYCYFFDKPVGVLLFICKDTYEMLKFPYYLEDWRDRVDEELDILRGFWFNKRTPPAQPRLYKGKECVYCNFFDLCRETEVKTIGES